MLELQAKTDRNQTNSIVVPVASKSQTRRTADRTSSFNRILDKVSSSCGQKNQLSSTANSTVQREASVSSRMLSSRPVEQKLDQNKYRAEDQSQSLPKARQEQEIVVANKLQFSGNRTALETEQDRLTVAKGEVSDQADNNTDQTNPDQRMDMLVCKLIAATGVIKADVKTVWPESVDLQINAAEESPADSAELPSLVSASPEEEILQVLDQDLAATSLVVKRDFDLNAQAVIEKVVKQLAELEQSGQAEVKMQLKPEDLGQIIIKTAVSDGNLSLALLTDNPQVEELLTANLSSLQSKLNIQQLVVELDAKPQVNEKQTQFMMDQTLAVNNEVFMSLQSQPGESNAAGTNYNEYDFNPQIVMEQLVKQLADLTQSEQSEATIQLKPDNLGQIILATTVSNGNRSTTLRTDNPQVKQLLAVNLPVLQNILNNQTLTVAQDVNQQPGDPQTSLLFSQILNTTAVISLPKSTETTTSNNPVADPVAAQPELLSNAAGLEKLRFTQTQAIDPQELMKQVVTQLEEQNNDSNTTLTIQLKPEVMDEIVVKTAMADGKTNVQLLTDNPQVKKILTANLEELKKTLNCQQLTVELNSGKLTNQPKTDLAVKPSLEISEEITITYPNQAEQSESSMTGASHRQSELLPMGNGMERVFVNQGNIKTDMQVPQSYPANSEMDSQDIMEQIVKKVELLNKANNSEMTIQLKPEFLGKMMIKLIMDDGVLTARFTTESQQVKNLLEANLNSLKQNLEANGIKVERTEVNVQLDNGGNPGNWGGNTQDKWQEYASRQQNQYNNNQAQDSYAGYSEEGFSTQQDQNESMIKSDGRVDFMI